MNVVILAGERPGGDPLAIAEGVANKTQIVIEGQPMLAYVLAAVRGFTPAATIYLCGQAADVARDVAVIAPAATPCTSVLRVLETVSLPMLITTADHPLLTPALLNEFYTKAASRTADVCVGMVTLARVMQHYPESRRTRLRFKGGSVSGANLFLLRNDKARPLIDFWRQMEANRKSPLRMLRVLGITPVLRYALGRLSLADVVAIVEARTGTRIAPILLDDPQAAIDVDRAEDLALVRSILQTRFMKDEGST